jgi:hypothetical protein
MNLRVNYNTGNFLSSWKLVSFSRRTELHGVSKYADRINFGSQEKWGKYSRHLQCPVWVEDINTSGCCLVSWGDCQWHCYHHLSAMQPLVWCLTPWLGWTIAPVSHLWALPPSPQQGCQYCIPSFVSWSLIRLWQTKIF